MTTSYKYPNALIYRIVCNETGEVYIGSTVGTLEQRMCVHRTGAKRYNTWVANGSVGKRPDGAHCCSLHILNRGNYEYFEIQPYPCNTKPELYLREGDIQIKYKKELGALCINICIAGAHARAGGKVEYNKQYNKQYYKNNAEKLREQSKQYYKENADTICEYTKQYNQKNATKIAARKKVKHDCAVCGAEYTHGHKARHFKSQMHQRAMQSDASAQHD